jgi:hypothetical protein
MYWNVFKDKSVQYVPYETLIRNYYLKVHLMLRAGQIQGILSRLKPVEQTYNVAF